MSHKTLGQELLASIHEALAHKGKGTVVRPKINVAEVRKKLGMTQKEFSLKFYIKLQTLRNWEQGKRIPDSTTLAYLVCISSNPKEILKILHPKKEN